jgi:hypothetical protein
MIFVQMFWDRVGVHFDMGEFGGVPLEMNFKVPFSREATAANVALEGSLPRVRPYMNLESRVAPENFTAITASMLEEGLVPTSSFRVVWRQRVFPSVFSEREFVRQIVGQ